MTGKGEFFLGLFLWVKGVFGCTLTVLFVTKHLWIPLTICGLLIILGFYLMWCAAMDWFADEFHDDVKEGYTE